MALDSARQALLASRLRNRGEQAPQRKAAEIPRLPDDAQPQLSFAQERMWFMEQFAPETSAYAVPVALRMRGRLDAPAMGRALQRVVDRHETLRMRFPATQDGKPRAEIADAVGVSLPVREAEDDDAARRLAVELLAEPFDLTTGPMLRGLLIRVEPEYHVLVLVMHHIAFDGYSLDILLGDLFAAYGGDPRGEPRVRYRDFAAWQRGRIASAEGKGDLAYWRSRLSQVPVLELPHDLPRPPEPTYRGASYSVLLGRQLTDKLAALGAEHGCTSFMTMLAAYQALLFRHSGQTDFAIGTPYAGRGRPELENLIGLFVNTLVLRADLSGAVTVDGLLERTRESVLDAFTHRELPVEHLISALDLARDTSRPTLFQAFFALQNYGGWGDAASIDLALEGFPMPQIAVRFDLELYISETADGLTAMFVYNTDLFSVEAVERLGGHFARLLESAVADPGRRVAELDLLGADERRLVLDTWNATEAAPPTAQTLHDLVAEQIARTPNAVAVTFEGESLTYAQLDQRAEAVAKALRGRGISVGDLVAVFAERSLELVAGLLGVLRSGAAYVPLDPDYPVERLAFMLEDSQAGLVLTQRRLAGSLPASAAEVVCLDELDREPVDAVSGARSAGSDDPAYVIYTSGSTGRPKGVINSHRGIVNRLTWMQKRYRLAADDVVLQKTPASFDVSVWEFFWPLLSGARLVLARPGGHRDAGYLRDLIAAEGITTAHFVPSMLAVFLADEGAAQCVSLRRILCSGEELPARLAAACRSALPAELHNLYGPTEAAIDVSAWQCTDDDGAAVPIGRPVDNTRLYVLDDHFNPKPIGVPGELYIAGTQVALGYLNRPELTAQRFLRDPFGPAGARMYATGDRAAWRADGALMYHGRKDDQVKIRGVRIELGEIEHALRGLDGVRDAVAAVREDRPGDKRLVAYVVEESEGAPAPDALRSRLLDLLPEALVPSAFVTLSSIPVTVNGKADRKALPAPDLGHLAGGAHTAPSTPTEHAIAEIWRDVLGLDEVGIDADFFAVGGHSLLATQVVARMRKLDAPGGVSVMALFKNPTIRRLAALADGGPSEDSGKLLHRLTRPQTSAALVTRSLLCIPYGGGSAVVYQPLADSLPPGNALYSVAIPGHDIGLDEDRLAFDALAERLAQEVLDTVPGPLTLYGHCGVGSALVVELARRLEAAGRTLEAVYIGAIFPFSRPPGRIMPLLARLVQRDRLVSDRIHANWLKSTGIDMDVLDPAQAKRIIGNMRKDSLEAENYFTGLIEADSARLKAPVVSVVGDHDPAAEYFGERFREWHFLTDEVGLVVLEEAGHFFLKYRARDLARIVTEAAPALAAGKAETLSRNARGADADWWIHGQSSQVPEPEVSVASAVPVASAAPAAEASAIRPEPSGPAPGMGRFLLIAASQLVSMTGSALTDFALPLWIFLQTGSLARFGLLTVAGLVPGLLLAPIAGMIVDRSDRRRVMIAGDLCAGLIQAAMAVVYVSGHLTTEWVYGFIACLSIALTFQRNAYGSAIPQLVPKRYLGHANGIAQAAGGIAQVVTPLIAVGLLALIGLGGILTLDVVSYTVAVLAAVLIRFPATLPFARREPALVELRNGWRMCWGQPGLRAMMIFFAVLNIFLGPPFLLLSPLILAHGTLTQVGRVALVAGLGVTCAGVAMGAWGGPRHRRMSGMLAVTAALAACCGLVGISPALPAIGAAAFGMAFFLTLVQGIFFTIIQTKVPQRYHGRVLAINFTVNWSTLPLAYGLIGPFGAGLFGPMLEPGGALASTAGRIVGVGPGRGIGFMYVLLAVIMLVIVAVAASTRVLGRFDRDVPDALPDDLVGEQVRRARRERQLAAPVAAAVANAASETAASENAVFSER
jgi:amino acid adenylation domain-containing protein